MLEKRIVIIGAGPTGLTLAAQLAAFPDITPGETGFPSVSESSAGRGEGQADGAYRRGRRRPIPARRRKVSSNATYAGENPLVK